MLPGQNAVAQRGVLGPEHMQGPRREANTQVLKGGEAAPFVTDRGVYPDDISLACPGCRWPYTHIERVGTLVGGDEGVVAYPGTVTSGLAAPFERRSAVEIVCSCENCQEWFALVIQQTKGVNTIEIHRDVEQYRAWREVPGYADPAGG